MKRFVGIDFIKTFAAFSIISVHFFLNTYYYYNNLILCENLFIQTYLRWIFMMCVPLFIISTGYLQLNKKINKNYYLNFLKVIGIYILYSLLSIIVRIIFFKETQSVLKWMFDIAKFSANPYSWYINMYFGLYLLIPFLNLITYSLKNKKEHILLIFILLILCGLPSFFNFMPITNEKTSIFYFPDWWMGIYPLLYYFIGNYIKKYTPKKNKVICCILLISIVFIETILTFYFSNGGYFFNATGEYNSILVIFSSILFFLLFYDINFNHKIIDTILNKISSISLDIYLGSYVVDRIVYYYVMDNIYISSFQIIFYFIPIISFIICTTIFMGLFRKLITKYMLKIFSKFEMFFNVKI